MSKKLTFFLFTSSFVIALGFIALISFNNERLELQVILPKSAQGIPLQLSHFEKSHRNVRFQIRYIADTEFKRELHDLPIKADIVFLPSKQWLKFTDSNSYVKYRNSILTSPTVILMNKKHAKKYASKRVKLNAKKFMRGVTLKSLTFSMPSPKSSALGMATFFGFIEALVQDKTLRPQQTVPEGTSSTKERILSPYEVLSLKKVQNFLQSIDINDTDNLLAALENNTYDGVVTTEQQAALLNKRLKAEKKESFAILYFKEADLAFNLTLGFIDKGDPEKENVFNELRTFLTSPEVQNNFPHELYRTRLGDNYDPKDWQGLLPHWHPHTECPFGHSKIVKLIASFQEIRKEVGGAE